MPAKRVLGGVLTVILLAAVAVLLARLGPATLTTSADSGVLVTWTSRGLPDGFGSAIADLDAVDAVSVVRGDTVNLVASWDDEGTRVDEPPPGMTIPLDALAVDPAKHAAVLDSSERTAIAALEPGQALLGESSARLRGLGAGAQLEFDSGRRVTVARVVPDEVVAFAEVVLVAPTDEVPTERLVRLVHTGPREEVEAAIRAAGGDRSVNVRGSGEQRVLRHGGSLLPQVTIKERFGEFAYRPAQGRLIDQNDAWVDRHIQVATVPILGEVACNREIIQPLRDAMSELAAAGLADLIDPSDYAGCYGPRVISPGEGLSRHAWGIAVDLNATTNAYGATPTLDARVVEAMERQGFSWGGTWLVPDGMHFEYVGDL